MRDDEERVVDAFSAWLERHGWFTRRKVNHVDVLATREGTVLYAEVKGRTQATGTDVDTGYGQLLRRMRQEDEISAIFALVVPDSAVWHVHRVPQRVREGLRIHVYSVTEADVVSFVGDGVDPVA